MNFSKDISLASITRSLKAFTPKRTFHRRAGFPIARDWLISLLCGAAVLVSTAGYGVWLFVSAADPSPDSTAITETAPEAPLTRQEVDAVVSAYRAIDGRHAAAPQSIVETPDPSR